ncbi:hypothetical protein F5X97DRAFT_38788 [Nemania serpens]|nr:hypothetical protein F5X97DRAFT_38788 [Nemania serpens]
MAAAENPQQQPNFDALSGYLHGMSIEVGRCSNLPAIRHANAVEDAVAQLTQQINNVAATMATAMAGLHQDMRDMRQEMRQEMRDMRQEMRQEMRDMRQEMRQEMRDMQTSLERRIDDTDHNNRARVLNSMALQQQSPIYPLRNPITHELVDLPGTKRELNALRVTDVEDYLRALGQEPVGNGGEKRTHLKQFIGINVA